MTNPTPEQRGEVYARILRDLTELTPIASGTPSILGPIYGASMCDRALKVMRAFGSLIIGLEDALPDSMWRSQDRTCRDHAYRASFKRETLRAEAGDPPIIWDELRHSARGIIEPPPSLAEHHLLGAKLKAVHNALIRAECDIGNAGGKHRNDLLSRVRKTARVLLTLRSHLDSAVQREHPADDARWRNLAAIYFGATAHPPSNANLN